MGADEPQWVRFDWERLLRRLNLPATTKAVGLMLATYADGETGQNMFPSVRRLAADCNLSTRAVCTHLEKPWCAVNGCGRPSTEVDHIIPLSRGGAPLDRWNLQGMCKHHNAAKGARTGVLLRDPDRPPLRVFDDGPDNEAGADDRPPSPSFFDDDSDDQQPRRS